MGKRKAREAGLFIPRTATPEQSSRGTSIEASTERETSLEKTTNQELVEVDIGSRGYPLPEVTRVADQWDRPTVLTVDEGIATSEAGPAVTKGGSEDDVDPPTFWQLLELAGYEIW